MYRLERWLYLEVNTPGGGSLGGSLQWMMTIDQRDQKSSSGKRGRNHRLWQVCLGLAPLI